jgi:hypothetical protein
MEMASHTVISGLAFVAALSTATASMLIWILLTQPTTIAAALGQGSAAPVVSLLKAALQ